MEFSIRMLLLAGTALLLNACAVARTFRQTPQARVPTLAREDYRRIIPHSEARIRPAAHIALRARHGMRVEAEDSLSLLARPRWSLGVPDHRMGVFFPRDTTLSKDSTTVAFTYEYGWWGGLLARDFSEQLADDITFLLDTHDATGLQRLQGRVDARPKPFPPKRFEAGLLLDFGVDEIGLGVNLTHFAWDRLGYTVEWEHESANPDLDAVGLYRMQFLRAGLVRTLLRREFGGRAPTVKLDLGIGPTAARMRWFGEGWKALEAGAFAAAHGKMVLRNGIFIGVAYEFEREPIGGWTHEAKGRMGFAF